MDDTNESDIPKPTTELSKGIKPICKDTVNKICSGQVVLSLAVAVKELVENSIDAGAKLIEIKLKNQGLESVEVCDNGGGVEESNLSGMTAKYHTSKLREFIDLQEIETFGFRGEALSSLCSLCDMVIITRHHTSQNGIRVELDHNGQIKKKIPCARQVGTTVILTNLFSTLPVRKRDFTKNIKKEFAKMCQILQAYCLVSTNVRIICTNINPKGAKTTLMSTNGSESVMDNIQAVFGSRQASELIEIKRPMKENEKFTQEQVDELNQMQSSLINITNEDIDNLNLNQYKIEGWISSCSHGSGRSSKDRQFFYINSRPCDPKNIIKIVNEAYHRYNVHQFPFIYLNVIIDRVDVDVNLTPDKRQLLITNEKILILAVKKSLLNTFGNIPGTYKFQNTTLDTLLEKTKFQDPNSDDETKIEPNSQKFKEVLSQWKLTGDTLGPTNPNNNTKRKVYDEINRKTFKLRKIQEFLTSNQSNDLKISIPNSQGTDSVVSYKSESDSDGSETELSFNVKKIENFSKEFDMITSTQHEEEKVIVEQQIVCKTVSNSTPSKSLEFIDKQSLETTTFNSNLKEVPTELIANDTTDIVEQKSVCFDEDMTDGSICLEASETTKKLITLDTSSEEGNNLKPFVSSDVINITIDEIEKLVIAEENVKKNWAQAKLDRLKFKSVINPTQNKNAEEELQKEISKEMFSQMDIIGQFNLGFIIVRLDEDLFIVDQHASDEKYNFEDLQKKTVLQSQILTVPQSLELTAVNEMILIDNLQIFAKNGFKFQVDECAQPTKKVKLIAKPFSKNWEFGKEDIDELIFMLHDAPEDIICRPSRIRAMFASRACRKSVMIGKALNKSVMKKLIWHMGEIEQPWNCPHGRPTMRHLVNLAMLDDEKED